MEQITHIATEESRGSGCCTRWPPVRFSRTNCHANDTTPPFLISLRCGIRHSFRYCSSVSLSQMEPRPFFAQAQRRLSNAGGRLTAHNGKRARMPIVEPSRSADAAGVSRARVDCRRPTRPSGIGECPDRSLASPQVDQASPCDLRPLQTESAVARKSLAQNVAVSQGGSYQARQLSHAAPPLLVEVRLGGF